MGHIFSEIGAAGAHAERAQLYRQAVNNKDRG